MSTKNDVYIHHGRDGMRFNEKLKKKTIFISKKVNRKIEWRAKLGIAYFNIFYIKICLTKIVVVFVNVVTKVQYTILLNDRRWRSNIIKGRYMATELNARAERGPLNEQTL